MKWFFVLLLLGSLYLSLSAQSLDDFEILVKVKSSPLKDQESSGTCWSFATTSFIETEAIRMGKDPVSLSPIFYVAPSYLAKAEKYINSEGHSYFMPGDLSFSVIQGYQNFGAMPESVYNGIIEGDWQHDHLEMDNLLYTMVESIGKSGYGRIKPNSWQQSIDGVLRAYLGSPPAVFLYKDKLYSPQSFAAAYVGINPNDYLEITSYSHAKFYKMFALNIPANWGNNQYLNVPIRDFEQIIDNALNNGYSLAWDGDATEPAFDFDAGILALDPKGESKPITQALRQSTFEDESTTDDHNMHIVGKAKNEAGKIYYLLKNSEGKNNMDGFILMTKNALLLKTISILVHMDAIPSSIQNKCKSIFNKNTNR